MVQQALARGHEVFSAYKTHPPPQGKPVPLDLTSEKMVHRTLAEIHPDVVINTAALTDVELCETNPDQATLHNSTTVKHLAREAAQSKSFLVHVSTDYVFDGEKGFYSEEDEPKPINTYGASKLKGEREVMASPADWCIARTSVVYGWGRPHRPNAATYIYAKLSKREKVSMVKDQYASPTLNTNLAAMLVEIAERRITGILHTSGATPLNRYEFATRLAETFQFDRELIVPVEAREIGWKARRPRDSSLNVAKASGLLSEKPLPVSEALARFQQESTRQHLVDVS